MLVAAALVPDTALLVPGVAGVSDVLPDLRAAALDAVATATSRATRVVVVAPGPDDADPAGVLRASLGAVGVPDGLLGWDVPEVATGEGGSGATVSVPAVASSVALHLLARTGWDGPLRVVEVARDGRGRARAQELAARGARAVAEAAGRSARTSGQDDDLVALVVVGSGSGRHGPDAPLADDDRAPALDAALAADLADGGAAARDRLASLDPVLAAELAVSGWGPWQVLLGALAGVPVRAKVLAVDTTTGAHHLVALWESDAAPRPGTAVA
ncbi:hypothetical protein [Cellulomonas biazotea]|uniref:hypothetical protein n=3 Tax=Cellulomonas biazotea TaxID=1709 RepID=UPI0035EF4CDA